MSAAAGNNGAADNNANEKPFPPELFLTVPIILASTHGVYDLTIEPTEFTVPENVYIFETQTIGNYCLTAIDHPLWRLAQFRGAFNHYFAGGDMLKGWETYDDDNRRVFQSMHYYEPGDNIYNRTLTIGGGRTSTGTSARKTYAEMGFFRMEPYDTKTVEASPGDDDLRIPELEPLRTKLVGDEGDSTTYSEFITEYLESHPEDAEAGVIFIFSSCANYWKEDGNGKVVPKKTLERRLRLIEDRQREQDLKLMELTTAGPGGAGGEETLNLPEARELPARKAVKGPRAVYAPNVNTSEPFGENADPGFEERMNAVGTKPKYTADSTAGKAVFIKNANGKYKTILTNKGSAAFTRRNIANAKKKHGTVYLIEGTGFVPAGGRRRTRKQKHRRGSR